MRDLELTLKGENLNKSSSLDDVGYIKEKQRSSDNIIKEDSSVEPGVDDVDRINIRYIKKYIPGYTVVPKPIGKGGYGRVYKIIKDDPYFPQERAVKVVEVRGNEDPPQEYKEANLQKKYQEYSSHVVPITDIYQIKETNPRKLLINMDLMNGTVKDQIHDHHQFSSLETVRIARDVLRVLKAMEQEQAFHRDIKPGNILYDIIPGRGTKRYRVGDFGCARNTDVSGTITSAGTAGYYPIKDGLPNQTTDSYCLGISMIEMLTGELPTAKDKCDMALFDIPCEESLAGLLRKVCAFNMEERFESAAEFDSALKEWVDDHPEEVMLEDNSGDAIFDYGKKLMEKPVDNHNFRNIQRFFLKAFEKGCQEASYELARLYYNYPEFENIVLKHDSGKVTVSSGIKTVIATSVPRLIWNRLQAALDYSDDANNMLAVLKFQHYFEDADLDAEEQKRLISYLEKAADNGVPSAQYNYALLLFSGLYINRDKELAKKYLDKAKANNYKPALDFEIQM